LTDSIKLKCREAYTRDVGRGHIRIDYDSMEKLNISTGDFVEIEGKKKTAAKVLPLYPSDEAKSMARTDSIVRGNMKITIDDEIKITKIKTLAAIKIVVKPTHAIPPIDARYLTDAFEGTAMTLDDRVLVPYFGGRIQFQIIETNPKDPVCVTRSTIFVIEEDNKDEKKVTCPTCGSIV